MFQNAKDFITTHTRLIQPLYKSSALNFWKASTTGKTRYFKKYAEIEKKEADIHSNKKEFRYIEKFYKNRDFISDPLLRRQIELVYKSYKSKQGDKKLIKKIIDKNAQLEKEFNTFRANYKNKKVTDNQLREILKKTKNSNEAYETWDASKQIGEKVEKQILDVVIFRNKLANQLGYSNYYDMSFELQELNKNDLFKLFDRLEKLTREPFKKIKNKLDNELSREFKIKKSELRPWHYRDSFFQTFVMKKQLNLDPFFKGKKLEKLTKKFYQGIGMKIDDILAKSDLYEKPGKDQHAFCIGIDNPYDVRILCNLKSNEQWMDTMLHEFGHGVYDKYISPDLPYLLRSAAHTLSTEAIALLNGRMTYETDFLHEILGLPKSKAKILGRKAKDIIRTRMLVFTRWCLVMIYFEEALYSNPKQDLNKLWWDLVEKIQFLKRPEKRDKPDWASKTHIATAPVYYHNYLLGELHAAQLIHAMKKEITGKFKIVNNKKIGPFLIDKMFRDGATLSWNERLKVATGEHLNPDYFVKEYVRH